MIQFDTLKWNAFAICKLGMPIHSWFEDTQIGNSGKDGGWECTPEPCIASYERGIRVSGILPRSSYVLLFRFEGHSCNVPVPFVFLLPSWPWNDVVGTS